MKPQLKSFTWDIWLYILLPREVYYIYHVEFIFSLWQVIPIWWVWLEWWASIVWPVTPCTRSTTPRRDLALEPSLLTIWSRTRLRPSPSTTSQWSRNLCRCIYSSGTILCNIKRFNVLWPDVTWSKVFLSVTMIVQSNTSTVTLQRSTSRTL